MKWNYHTKGNFIQFLISSGRWKCQFMPLSVFSVFVNLIAKWCYLIVLICISLITNRVEYFFMWFRTSVYLCELSVLPMGCLVFLVVFLIALIVTLRMQVHCVSYLIWFNRPPHNVVKHIWGGYTVLVLTWARLWTCLGSWGVSVLLSHLVVAVFHDTMHQCTSSYQCPCVLFPYIFLAKVSHLLKHRVKVGDYTRAYQEVCSLGLGPGLKSTTCVF